MKQLKPLNNVKKGLVGRSKHVTRKKQKINHTEDDIHIDRIVRHDLGRMNQTCTHCDAKFWLSEKDQKSTHTSPTFVMCCPNFHTTNVVYNEVFQNQH